MSLRAPLAVVVEIQADERRWFRLSRNVGDDGIALERPVPLEIGHPVQIVFVLPLAEAGLSSSFGAAADAAAGSSPSPRMSLRAEVALDEDRDVREVGGSELAFIEPPREQRAAIVRYAKERLGVR